MGFPSTDYPVVVDSLQDRSDDVDVIWASDFDYQDSQIRRIQTLLGVNGDLIGDGVVNAGFGGLVSPVSDGGVAFKLAVREDFTSGSLLSLGDDYDSVYQERFRVNFSGVIWSSGGADLSAGVLDIPNSGTLPGTGVEGRLYYKTGADEGLYVYGSGGWALAGGGIGAGSYLEMGMNYSYSQPGVPQEAIIGQGAFAGSYVDPGTAYFRALVTPTFSAAGTMSLMLYDLGPKAGPPDTPRLVATISTTTNGGPQVIEQGLTVVTESPTGNEILDTARMYEVTVIQTSTVGDFAYVGSTGLEVR